MPNSDIQENEPWRLRAINHLAYVSQDLKSLAFGFHTIKAWRKDAGELLYTIEGKWASLLKAEALLHFMKGKLKKTNKQKNEYNKLDVEEVLIWIASKMENIDFVL